MGCHQTLNQQQFLHHQLFYSLRHIGAVLHDHHRYAHPQTHIQEQGFL